MTVSDLPLVWGCFSYERYEGGGCQHVVASEAIALQWLVKMWHYEKERQADMLMPGENGRPIAKQWDVTAIKDGAFESPIMLYSVNAMIVNSDVPKESWEDA